MSIVRYSFQSVYDPNCPYGAVSFHEDFKLKSITEIKTICSSSIEGNIQNVYSPTGRVFIVFYSYKEYSSLNVTVNVSYTRCQSVRIHACVLFETCLRRYIISLLPIRETCWEDHRQTTADVRSPDAHVHTCPQQRRKLYHVADDD